MSDTNVVLPAPVLPMTAVVAPRAAVKLMPDSTGAAAPGKANETSRNSISPWDGVSVIGASGGTTDDAVSRTSTMRSAHTAARGIIISMNVPMSTDMRICAR